MKGEEKVLRRKAFHEEIGLQRTAVFRGCGSGVGP